MLKNKYVLVTLIFALEERRDNKMDKRVLLCIMDGWGISTGSEKYDATKLAHPVNVPPCRSNG